MRLNSMAMVWAAFFLAIFLGTAGQLFDCEGDTLPELCPSSPCTCCLNKGGLTVDCNWAKEVEGFTSALTAIFTKYHLQITNLRITRCPLKDLQQLELCKLQNLQVLTLHDNELTTLGERRLKCLHHLMEFNAANNNLTAITNETFYGLRNIEVLRLNDNSITEISPHAFTDFNAVTKIDLMHNQLRTLDVWPLHFVATIPSNDAVMNVSGNWISNFTNHLDWTFDCSMLKKVAGKIDLSHNNISHVTDFIVGWRFDGFEGFHCLISKPKVQLLLEHNDLFCDCVDFLFYKYVKDDRELSGIQCTGPPRLQSQTVANVPLSDFVCEVQDNCTGGKCNCTEQPSTQTVIINCEGQRLGVLPETVPTTQIGYYNLTFSYEIQFKDNNLKAIQNRTYLHNTRKANFQYNKIASMDMNTWSLLKTMDSVYLADNNLTELPDAINGTDLGNMTSLSLYGNPWLCNCSKVWFKKWLISIKNVLKSRSGILCGKSSYPTNLKDKNIISVPDEDFCRDDEADNTRKLIIAVGVTVGGVLVLLLVPTLLVYCYRVWLFANLKWHPFNRDECDGEEKHFDVFVSYANDDETWVRRLVHDMEAEGFGTLFHKRDFIAGRPITENVGLAVDRSKRTLCVLSRRFAASDTCMWEFTTALNIDLQENKHRLITILKEPIPVGEQPTSLRHYLRHFTYIESDNRHFMDNLLYALPVEKIGLQPHLCEAAANTATHDIENTGRGRPLEDEQNSVDQFEPDLPGDVDTEMLLVL
nr:Toll-like receptor 13 [Arenicola marina]